MDYTSTYTDFLKKHVKVDRKLRVVCDASNGTTSLVLQKMTDIGNVELILINSEMNPEFPAHGPNPLLEGATNDVVKKVLETKSDFGVVFDGDGDRVFFVDNEGEILPSFITAAMLFRKEKPPFIADELVYMSLTSSGLYSGKEVLPARVGSLFIKEAILKNSASVGAEFSGHFYFRDFFGLDSGIFALVAMMNSVSAQSETLAEIHKKLSLQSVSTTNVTVRSATWDIIKDNIKKETASYAKNYFEREGLTYTTRAEWVNIRSSNTEPVVRITVGSSTEEECKQTIAKASAIIANIDK